MNAGTWYWLILVLSVIFGGVGFFGPPAWRGRGSVGFGLIVLILLALIGYRVFGSPVQ
jgi:hypothetical protein